MLKSALLSLAAVAAAAVSPQAASATPVGPVSKIEISIAPALRARTKEFGASDFEVLTTELRKSLEAELTRKGRLVPSGGALAVVIEDAKSTRPTFRQMTEKTSLSFESFGLGGVKLTGTYKAPDGAVTPLSYDYTETDLLNASYGWTWSGARDGFQRFAWSLTRG